MVINKCVTAVKVSNFSGHYLSNRSNLDIGVLGYIGIVQHKEHSPEVLSIPPGTPCIRVYAILQRNRLSVSYLPNLFINRLHNLITNNPLLVQAACIVRSPPTNDTLS